MNIYYIEFRFDCEKFVLCGCIFLYKCWKYKGRLDECRGCMFVYCKVKMVVGMEVGRKVCLYCGCFFLFYWFYNRIVRYGDKEY